MTTVAEFDRPTGPMSTIRTFIVGPVNDAREAIEHPGMPKMNMPDPHWHFWHPVSMRAEEITQGSFKIDVLYFPALRIQPYLDSQGRYAACFDVAGKRCHIVKPTADQLYRALREFSEASEIRIDIALDDVTYSRQLANMMATGLVRNQETQGIWLDSNCRINPISNRLRHWIELHLKFFDDPDSLTDPEWRELAYINSLR